MLFPVNYKYQGKAIKKRRMVDTKTKIIGMSSRWGVMRQGKAATHFSYGRVVDELARHFKKCYVSMPVCASGATSDYVLQSDNIELLPQPPWRRAVEGLRHPIGVLKSAKRLVDLSDVVFIRGYLPYVQIVYLYAALRRKPVVQWVVTNPAALMQAARRHGRIRDKLSYLYSVFEAKCLNFFRRFATVYIAANGCELYEKYRSDRTFSVVSSTIREDEFYQRQDTCQAERIRILFTGFVRPEKGLIYLIEALAQLETSRDVTLAVVGDTDGYPGEVEKIRKRIAELGLEDKVSWEGYASFGTELFDQLRKSDIFVLPTLSEGTPRVLIEARAFGLPVIASNVGGIPSSVTDGKDGILVPPKSPQALAAAIDNIIEDSELRRNLIRDGYLKARQHTLEKFIASLIEIIKQALSKTADLK